MVPTSMEGANYLLNNCSPKITLTFQEWLPGSSNSNQSKINSQIQIRLKDDLHTYIFNGNCTEVRSHFIKRFF